MHSFGHRHAERQRGYRTGMRRHGLTPDVVRGDHTEESGVRAARDLLGSSNDVTAVFAGNDRCAVGVLDTLRRAGIDVPGDVSVVGYDDSRLARLAHIDLTSIAQDAGEPTATNTLRNHPPSPRMPQPRSTSMTHFSRWVALKTSAALARPGL